MKLNLRQKCGILKPLKSINLLNIIKWIQMYLSPLEKDKKQKIFFGFNNKELSQKKDQGGLVKIKVLAKNFNNISTGWNILYLVSSALPDDWPALILIAKLRNAKIILNQNGVAYPAWHGWGWRLSNLPLKIVLRLSDLVLYQSKFCKKTADTFLGKREKDWLICYNAVKINKYNKKQKRKSKKWKILLGGTQYQKYRLKQAIEILAIARKEKINVSLTVLGDLCWRLNQEACKKEADSWCVNAGIEKYVTFIGRYTQKRMPKIFKNHDILLHTKINDPCPTVVLEGLASGLPVIYSKSGGVPELVGNQAGIGIRSESNWLFEKSASPSDYIAGLKKIIQKYMIFKKSAHQRAEIFSETKWIKNHKHIFGQIKNK